MKRFFQSEAGATVLWVLSSLLLAAVIAPWLYRVGIELGEAAATRNLPAFLEWVGASSARAKFSRYYSRSLVLAAVVLLPFLLRRIRLVRARSLLIDESCRRFSWQCIVTQIGLGFAIAATLLWTLGILLHHWGAYVVSPKTPGIGKLISAVMVPAVAASLLEEWLFRGLLLGLWLRFSKPLAACVGSSLFFAFIHFLEPPAGWVIANPAAPWAGFELLGKIMWHFADPRFFVTDFATLFVIGMILAWARLRTGALWFPIGLHAGWIFAFKGYNLLFRGVPSHSMHPWALGDSLRSGLLPMLTLAVTVVICDLALRRFEPKRLMA
ncbi:MAG: CPBP family intramembrane glutamic endopeptidase [Verrucomicrobiota bacterium]